MPVDANMHTANKIPLNIAIVGGGRSCKYFLELLNSKSFPYFDINLVGVCDIHPKAEGLLMARKMGIYTTDNFQDLFDIKDLDGIIELTGRREVLLELIKLRPQKIAIVEHNLGRVLRSLLRFDQQLKSAEQQVIREKNIIDFLIQQANERIVVLNTDFTIHEANEAYLEAVGKTKDEVIGGYCYNVLYGLETPCINHKPEYDCPMVETLRTAESAHVIMEVPVSGDQPAYFDIVTYPVKNAEEDVERVIEIYRDITKELSTRWEKKVQELKHDLHKLIQEDRMISLGKLVASCVHEINNPIQGLLTFSRLMEDILAEGPPASADLEQFKEYLSLMTPELERCGDIISGLLSFSRETPRDYVSINLNEALESVMALTRHKMELQSIKLTPRLFPGLLMVHGNKNQLQQCLLNLIFNAMEAMPQGGELKVNSDWDESQNKVRVEIHDTGFGIDKKEQGHIFDPFFSTKKEGRGTGLGLSITYGVVKKHRGDIWVKSTPGKGSTFFITFPGPARPSDRMEEQHGR